MTWTAAQDAYLRKHFPHNKTEGIAKALGKRPSTVTSRAIKLGLSKTDEFIRSCCDWRRADPTEAQAEYIRAHFPCEATARVAEALGIKQSTVITMAAKLDVKKDEEYKRAQRREQVLRAGEGTRIKPGALSWNKGKRIGSKGRSAQTQFKAGSIPFNLMPVGSERVVADGYLYRKISDKPQQCLPGTIDNGRWKAVHRINWEEANGPIPDGAVISFIDGNRLNVHISNLILLDREDQTAFQKSAGYGREIREASVAVYKLKRMTRNEKYRRPAREDVPCDGHAATGQDRHADGAADGESGERDCGNCQG